jgi:hypothetical protein
MGHENKKIMDENLFFEVFFHILFGCSVLKLQLTFINLKQISL